MLDYEKNVLDAARRCIDTHEKLTCSQAHELIDLYTDFGDAMHDLHTFASIDAATFRREHLYPAKDSAIRMHWLAERLWNALKRMQSFVPDWGVAAQKEYRDICDIMNRCLPIISGVKGER